VPQYVAAEASGARPKTKGLFAYFFVF
jgi:hypothetical protein